MMRTGPRQDGRGGLVEDTCGRCFNGGSRSKSGSHKKSRSCSEKVDGKTFLLRLAGVLGCVDTFGRSGLYKNARLCEVGG